MEQITLFDLTRPMVKIDKPIRLIEFFAGYGSQSMALRNLGVDYEMWKAIEIDPYVMASYNAVHGTSFEPTDIKNIGGGYATDSRPGQVLLSGYILFPVPRHQLDRTTVRIVKRLRNKIIIVMGSRENPERTERNEYAA